MNEASAGRLSLANFWVGFAALFVAALLGLYQVAERAGMLPPEFISPVLYFASVTTHGVLMAYVMSTFVIMGFGYSRRSPVLSSLCGICRSPGLASGSLSSAC